MKAALVLVLVLVLLGVGAGLWCSAQSTWDERGVMDGR